MKKLFILIVCIWACSLAAWSRESVPQVIPALQSWKGYSGTLVLPEEGRIVIEPSAEKQLVEVASTLADDLKEMFGRTYRVTTGKPSRQDIYLYLAKPDKALGEEGYELDIRSYVSLGASAPKGVFWGTRTLLQMLYNQPEGLQKGKATDYPAYAHRGFMLDTGRKFFTMDFLKSYVKILSFYKMNEFQIHLNDNGFVEFFDNDWNKTYAAFRLESDCFPGLTAKDGSYSKEEFRDFQKMANRYGIEVIPEIDVPAHSLAFTHYNPKLAAEKKEYGMDHLDLYKPEVYEFLDTLFAEYIGGDNPVFTGPYVHIGTDEYNIKEVEQFRYFTDYYLKYIRSFGKTPRLWGSLKQMKGTTPVDVKGCYVNAWNYGWLDLDMALKEGYKVINTCDAYLYIVPAVNYYHDYLDTRWLYNEWTPEQMDNGFTVEKGNPDLLGAMFAVWNDRVGNGISQQDVHARCFPAVQVLSEKMWKGVGEERMLYDDFEALCRRMPEAPGVNLLAKVKEKTLLTAPEKTLKLSGTDTLTTALDEIGYPYAVEFELCPDAAPASDAVLFKGPHSVFLTNWNGTGKFAFRRDGYEFVFHNYRLPAAQWTKVRVEGDLKGTSLYINGKLEERLEGRTGEVYNSKRKRKDRIWYMETLVFPLRQIGDSLMGFKGQVKNVVCMPGEEK